jgi:hypothetical protein
LHTVRWLFYFVPRSGFDAAVRNLPPELRGKKARGAEAGCSELPNDQGGAAAADAELIDGV